MVITGWCGRRDTHDAGLTAAWRQEASAGETIAKLTFSHHTCRGWDSLPPVLPLKLHTYKRPHILPHSLSCNPVYTHTLTHAPVQWIPLLKLAPSQQNLGRAPRFHLANSSLFSLTIFNAKNHVLIVCKQSANYVYVFVNRTEHYCRHHWLVFKTHDWAIIFVSFLIVLFKQCVSSSGLLVNTWACTLNSCGNTNYV